MSTTCERTELVVPAGATGKKLDREVRVLANFLSFRSNLGRKLAGGADNEGTDLLQWIITVEVFIRMRGIY